MRWIEFTGITKKIHPYLVEKNHPHLVEKFYYVVSYLPFFLSYLQYFLSFFDAVRVLQ